MKRLIAVVSFAVLALPAAAAEHGGPWELSYQGSTPESSAKAPAAVENDFNFIAPPQ